MQKLIFFVFCFFISMHSVVAQPAQPKDVVRNRIYHGEAAHKGQFPFAGYLSWGFMEDCTWEIQCGGSIIHKRWALTANHCWFDYNSTANFSTIHPVFTVGTIFRLHNGTLPRDKGVSREVLRFYLNPNLSWEFKHINPDTGLKTIFVKYDEALMSFEKALEYNEFIQPIRLDYGLINKVDKESFIGKDVTIIGWGRTDQRNYKVTGRWRKQEYHTLLKPTTLRFTDTKTVNENRCHLDSYKHDITTDDSVNICLSSRDQRTGCYGDSGGPLLFNHKNKLYQIGVASYVGLSSYLDSFGNRISSECGDAATVYSRVDVVFQWIYDTLASCGDNIFDPDTYGNDTISIKFQPTGKSVCKIQTQREYEIAEIQKEEAERNRAKASFAEFESKLDQSKDPALQPKRTDGEKNLETAELERQLEARDRAKNRGTGVLKESITPIEPLPYR